MIRMSAITALLLGLTGCFGSPKIETMCVVDADCQAGLRCHDGRVCVTLPEAPHELLLRVAPPPGSGLVQEHFNASLLPEPGAYGQTWQLSKPAAVRGTVIRAKDPFHSSIPGTLIATAPGEIQGVTLRYEATSYSTPRAFEGSDQPHGFELLLQVGPTYQVTFWPDSADIPPYTATLKVGGDTNGWSFELPADEEVVTVKGRFVTAASPEQACQPECVGCQGVEGLRVVLVDDAGRVCSSRGVTDSKGAFSVQIHPSVQTAHLRLSPADATIALPTGRLATAVDLKAAWKKSENEIDLNNLLIGDLSLLKSRAVLVRDEAGEPVGGAQVKVMAKLPSPERCEGAGALFSSLQMALSGPTDVSGQVNLTLPKTAVQVDVKPPMGHSAARWTGVINLAKGEALDITCGARATLTGKVTDFEGVLVDAATVRFTSLVDLKMSPVETKTKTDGTFEVKLDGGDWAVVIEPPEGRGLGRYSKHLVSVDLLHPPLPLDVVLPAPAVMSGRVLDRDGNPMSGVLVDVLAQDLADLSAKELPMATGSMDHALYVHETHLLGTGVTSEDGRFEVLVETSQLAP